LDFLLTVPGEDPIIVEGYFAVTPSKMFQAWTDPEIVIKWFGPKPNSLHSATIDLQVGGAWQFLKSKDETKSMGFAGQYQVIEPDKRLLFTWSRVVTFANGQCESTPDSQVEVTFSAKGAGTELRVVHSAVHNEEMRKGFGGGWTLGLNNLSDLISSDINY
jgi:uncharacterized protein YndB with AHSA1/START domain